MKLDYKAILDQKSYLALKSQIPNDLLEQINALEKVKRFQFKEYPKNVIIDDTKLHTIKCVNLVRVLGLENVGAELERTLWIHDITELLTGDITAIEKNRKAQRANKFNMYEESAATQSLTKKDQRLFANFNNANKFLKGKTTFALTHTTLAALFAKIIDNSEGNMTFHYFISRWVASDKFDLAKLPPQDSLKHTFLTNQKFLENVQKSLPNSETEKLTELIELVLRNIRNMWKDMPSSRTPSVVKEYL